MGTILVLAGSARAANFPDGTGSITVPKGWSIASAYRGSVDVRGPNGAAVILGLPYAVIDSRSSLTGLPAAAQSPIALTGDVGTALRQIMFKSGAQLTNLRARSAPQSFPGVPAYYVFYQWNAQGRSWTAIGYFTSIIYQGSDSWQLYTSAVVAPTAVFTRTAPTMLNMWRSWRPNGQLPSAGSESAQVDKIIRDSNAQMDRIQAQFREQL